MVPACTGQPTAPCCLRFQSSSPSYVNIGADLAQKLFVFVKFWNCLTLFWRKHILCYEYSVLRLNVWVKMVSNFRVLETLFSTWALEVSENYNQVLANFYWKLLVLGIVKHTKHVSLLKNHLQNIWLSKFPLENSSKFKTIIHKQVLHLPLLFLRKY